VVWRAGLAQLTDASQNEVVSYRYRAFGEQTVVSGSSPNRFGWVGRVGYYRQPDSDDYWVRARVCLPSTGRWISRDRLVGQPPYSLAGNRVPKAADPSGLRPTRDDEGPDWTAKPGGYDDPCGGKLYTWGKRFPERDRSPYARCVRRNWKDYTAGLRAQCRDCRRQCKEQLAKEQGFELPLDDPELTRTPRGDCGRTRGEPGNQENPYGNRYGTRPNPYVGLPQGSAGHEQHGPPHEHIPVTPRAFYPRMRECYLFNCTKSCVWRTHGVRLPHDPRSPGPDPVSKIDAWAKVERQCKKYRCPGTRV
jgi:hypothetical protein